MKKKQQDFQKVKLKVGKHLPKGRNETRTSFQTRKINMREQIKETIEESTLKELLSFMKSADVKTKYYNLRKLLKYVSDHEDALSMFFPDILKELGRTLQESDPEIRLQAITVLGRCAEILTDVQFKSFVVPLTSYLNCMMTHITFRVKQDSLKFLDALLNSHPSIICQSSEVLFYLLNMISCTESSTAKKGSKNKDGRKLIDIINSKVSADEWRMQVLERMLTFLSGMLSEKNDTEMITDHQKEVYWNAEEALYLPLYLNSGVKPAKFDYSLYSSVNFEGCDSTNFKKFIHELICVLSAILKSFATNRSFSESNIKYLSIIAQILCCTGEWAIQSLDLDDDMNPVQKLIPICDQLLKGFPYHHQAGKSAKRYEVECVLLNLGIAHLYCMCSFLSDIPEYSSLASERSYFDKWEVVKMYLAAVFQGSGLKMTEKAISQTLKICRILIRCTKLDALAKDGVLVALLGTLDTNKFSSSANDIYSFFMDLSLNYDHRNLLATQAMRSWFQSLIKNLSFMLESKMIIPDYLNYLKQICSRRNPYFMETLKNLPYEKLIEFFRSDDEDVQLTTIHLIMSLDNISEDLLQDLAETIRDESVSLKTASKSIRMLHTRFSLPGVPLIDKMNFLKFLLNLGCDTFLISDPSLDTNPLPLTDMLISSQQSFACQCEIYPTADFERHYEIFKVCAECFPSYLGDETLVKCVIIFIRTLFREHVRFPVHSLVAVIELFDKFKVLQKDGHSAEFVQNLVYSSMLYNCWLTNEVPQEHWTEYCAPAVQDCLRMVDASDVITYMNGNLQNFREPQINQTMRMIIFLMQKGLLDRVNKNYLFRFFEKLNIHDAVRNRPVCKYVMEKFYDYVTNP